MAIFRKLKQAFGFSGSEYDDEDDAYGVDSAAQSREHRDNQSTGNEFTQVSTDTVADVDDAVTTELPVEQIDAIFATVVAEFNKALPAFIAEGANAEAQRRFLYDALNDDTKVFMQRVQSRAVELCNRRWEKERLSLNARLTELKARQQSLETTESEKSKQLLSAERQKRALNERVHDLESQIATLEAEKDQYELETRSLVNKLRVSNMVNEGMEIPDVSTYEERIAAMQADIDRLTGENETLTAAAAESADQSEAKTKQLTDANAELQHQVDSLKMKVDMTDVMINDLNTRASSASKEAESQAAELESLRQKLKDAIERADNAELELEEARANLEIAASIQTEVERIQEAITAKNKQISELNDTVRRREDRINALEAEEASLRRTIESNLMNQAESEKTLRAEIDQLQKQLATVAAKDRQRSKRKSSAPRISAIDEELDNTDWLVATPPEGTNARTSGVSDSEFGYQEPARKNPPENSAQMSLW
ncbi:MAG: hypothetical protein K2N28_03130 [Muribaculaceae bacterium]|nr:hypothetical protein [Muribaculaceae bacterium]